MAQRIRGQEVTINFLPAGGQNWTTLTDIRSFSVTPKFSKLEEQYLGETTKRYDEIYDGVDFDMELHFEDAGVIDFVSYIRERAARRVTSDQVTIKATLQFGNGTVKTVVLQDCFFENMPINFGSRSDYGTFKLTGSCSNFEAI